MMHPFHQGLNVQELTENKNQLVDRVQTLRKVMSLFFDCVHCCVVPVHHWEDRYTASVSGACGSCHGSLHVPLSIVHGHGEDAGACGMEKQTRHQDERIQM